MKTNKERRSFLGKLGIGLGTIAALPVFSYGRTLRDAIHSKNEPAMNPIKSVKPLGFQWDTADPFLFCVHHEDKFPKGNAKMGPAASMQGRSLGDDFIIKDGYRMYHGKTVPGFPGHPHRGFETITIVRDGVVDHADSLGAAGRYGYGDVQWMTAGKGVQHSEMFPLLHEDKENPLELFQIWLNLPKKSKMVDPHFKMLWGDTIPKYEHTNASGAKTKVEVIAGRLGTHVAPAPPPDSWAADPQNEVAIYNIKMDPGASWVLPAASPGINRSLYYYVGDSLTVNGAKIPAYHGLEVDASAKLTLESGSSKARILMLQGRPIGEQVIQYGPFVMNTKAEIQQAFEDYHQTQFGGWPWPKKDQVHDRNAGRFAIHADGLKEIKG
jgi:redox-sensitive bicupin YhaK (pirin superfamily)